MKKILFYCSLMFMLTACGSTSNLRSTEDHTQTPNLVDYNRVIINDFTDGISKSQNDKVVLANGKEFAEILATKIKEKNIFKQVERNIYSDEHALLIDGKITQCDEGNPTARFLIGAGRAHFDAVIHLKDNTTKQILGDIVVDQGSWAFGGLIAASQDVTALMKMSSSKVISELEKAKKMDNQITQLKKPGISR